MSTIFFLAILGTFGAANLLWWRCVDRRMRMWRVGKIWRLALGAFALGMLAYVAGVGSMGAGHWLPMPMHVFAYLWNIFVLPITLVCMAALGTAVLLIGAAKNWHNGGSPETSRPATIDERELPSRRRVLQMAGAAIPPLVAMGLTGAAELELGHFRMRRVTLPVAGLPADLAGVSIAHVTDVHIGRFLPEGTLPKIVDAVRRLKADIVVFTGDALDASQHDIDPAIGFLRDLGHEAGDAYAIVEGNHDVSHGAEQFESTVLGAGLPLLLDSSKTVRLPGRATPIWLGGITWGAMVPGREIGQLGEAGSRLMRRNDKESMARSVSIVAEQRRHVPGAFPILLVHHPHAFDPAAAHGFPVTLAGHTHGGQIMFTRNIGAGPLRFRYWAGTHQRGNSRLVISNGVGNWFPLRINAPTEILHITLQPAESSATS